MTDVNLSYIAPPPRQQYIRGQENPFRIVTQDENLTQEQQEIDQASKPDIINGIEKTIDKNKRIPRDLNLGFNNKRDAYNTLKSKVENSK